MADLPYSSVVRAGISTSPQAAQRRGFGVLNIITKETNEKFSSAKRTEIYPNIDAVAIDWSASTEAYKAAQSYFAQQPKPKSVMVGVRFETAQPAQVRGGSVEATLAEFQAISDGEFDITVDGVNTAVTALNFATDTDFNQIAARISTALTGGTVTHDGIRFYVKTVATGVLAAISFLRNPTSPVGTDISSLMQCASAEEDAIISPKGVDAETISGSLNAIEREAGDTFYGFQFTKEIRDKVQVNGEDAVLAASAWAEARVKVFFNTTNDLDVLDSVVTTDICSLLQKNNLRRTISTYSSYPSQYPSSSVSARAFVVNFSQPNATITLKFKQLPTITTESIHYAQALTLDAKGCNALVSVGGNPMYQQGQMANGVFFDEVHGLDWLENAIQIAVFNVLYTSTTKVPFTNTGFQRLTAAVRKTLDEGVRNGLLAAGYTTDDFGNPRFLPNGYEVTYTKKEDMNQGDIDARSFNGIQFLALGAGALHSVQIDGVFQR